LDALEHSLGDLYAKGVYSFDNFFDFRLYYGAPWESEEKPGTLDDPQRRWVNHSVILELVQYATITVELLCCFREILALRGYRYDKS